MKFEFPGHRIFKISIFQGSNPSNTFSHDSFSTRAQLPSVFNIRTYIFGIICGPLTFLHMNEDNIYNKILGEGGRDFYFYLDVYKGDKQRNEKRDRTVNAVRFSGNTVKKKMVRCQPLILNQKVGQNYEDRSMVVWKVMAYLEQRFIGGRGCWYLNGVELLLEFGPVVVYVRHCDHDTGRRGEGRPSVVPDRHLKTKIKFLRIKCEIFLFRVCAM